MRQWLILMLLVSLVRAMVSCKPVISNKPKQDPRSFGVPTGHPPIRTFMGIPLLRENGECIGMIAVANKRGGYSEDDVRFLEPFTTVCGNLIQAYFQIQENSRLLSHLEEKVKERTQRLELANIELAEANRRVVKASAAQLQHFATVSHELRTPLTCVLGLLSVLLESELTPVQEESMRLIVASGELLVTVVNDLLDYAKLESGNVDIEVKRSNLQDTLSSLAHSIETKASKKEITLKTIYDPSVPEFVQMDSRRHQQILFNLLGNAVKFSDEGSCIELHVSLCEKVGENLGYTFAPADDELAIALSLCSADHAGVSLPPTGGDGEGSGAIFVSPTVKVVPANFTSRPKSAQPAQVRSVDQGSAGCPFTRPTKPVDATEIAQPTACEPMKDDTSPVSGCPFTRPPKAPVEAAPVSAPAQAKLTPAVPVLRFVVKDYGKGIEKCEFEKIFKPFIQATAETERVYGGTGLGLAITSKLTHLLGATISVDSEPGKWSAFTVDFPFEKIQAIPPSTPSLLNDTTVFMIGGCIESIATLSEAFRKLGVDCETFRKMKAVEESSALQVGKRVGKSCICLVDEVAYDNNSYTLLSQQVNSILLTHGPKFCVKNTSGHFRSLTRVLPSVLVNSMARAVEERGKGDAATYQETSIDTSCNASDDLRILIAEDNLVNQKVLCRMLHMLGLHSVDVVDDGKKAVDMEIEKEYDLVMMDLQMPVMDGIEACKNIVAREGGHSVPPVVFLSAHASASHEIQCTKAGGFSFLSKPFNFREIEAIINKVRKLKVGREDYVPMHRRQQQ